MNSMERVDVNGPYRPEFVISGSHKYSPGRTIEQQSFTGGASATGLTVFFANHESLIRQYLQSAIDRHRSIKFYMKMDISFTRPVDDETQTTAAGFIRPMTVTSDSSTLDLDVVKNNIMIAIENFNVR